jgi:hypothetical protein
MPSLTRVVIDWFRLQGWDDTEEYGYPLVPGPVLIDQPDRIVHITGTGGPGYVTDEGSADASTFQVRLRGPSDDPDEAEEKAMALDRLVLRASFPAQVDGVSIQTVHRLAGPPSPLPVNPADLRWEFTCQYVITHGVS